MARMMARIWCTNRNGFHPASAPFRAPAKIGNSLHPYQSLNLGTKVGDEMERVLSNRDALTAGCELKEIRFMDQIHSDLMVEAGVEYRMESCDGIFIRRDSWNDRIGLAVQIADCVPLILFGGDVIAAVHVGREGLVRGMTESALASLSSVLDLTQLSATIGPSICGDCYPLSEETYLAAAERYPKSIFNEAERKIDVAGGVISILESHQIPWTWFAGSRECVCCDDSYYSYRRDRITGRQAMVVSW